MPITAVGMIKGELTYGELSFNLDQPLTTGDLNMPLEDIKALVGDGGAKVSVSMGMSDKDYGDGFDVHVSISLTCDQDRDVVGFAYEAASDLCSEIILDAKDRVRELWNSEQRRK